MVMEDELGLNIMQTPSPLCWTHGSIVADLYRFRLHVYNCMTAKYHCLLQNHFPLATLPPLTSILLSFSWSVTALF
jgi:hypothetical protein